MAIAIFDLDNTLVDRDAAFLRWCGRFIRDQSLDEKALDALLRADGGGFRDRAEFVGELCSSFALSREPAQLLEWFWATFPPLFTPEDGVVEGLVALRRAGWTVGVATNGGPYQRAKLEAAGLERLVDVVCASAVEGVAKPDRRLLDLVAERQGGSLGPADWMVGDADVDVLAGRNAGVRTAWVRRGRTWALDEYQPDLHATTTESAIAAILDG